MPHIFISYSRRDSDYTLRLAHFLRDEGFDIWIDDRNIGAGDEWQSAIEAGINSCAAMIVVWSRSSKKSKWVNKEILRADRMDKTIFPVRIEDAEMPLALESTQYIDIDDGEMPDARFLEKLGEVVAFNAESRGRNILEQATDTFEDSRSFAIPSVRAASAEAAAPAELSAARQFAAKIIAGMGTATLAAGIAYLILHHQLAAAALVVDLGVGFFFGATLGAMMYGFRFRDEQQLLGIIVFFAMYVTVIVLYILIRGFALSTILAPITLPAFFIALLSYGLLYALLEGRQRPGATSTQH